MQDIQGHKLQKHIWRLLHLPINTTSGTQIAKTSLVIVVFTDHITSIVKVIKWKVVDTI